MSPQAILFPSALLCEAVVVDALPLPLFLAKVIQEVMIWVEKVKRYLMLSLLLGGCAKLQFWQGFHPEIKTYICRRAQGEIEIDGSLNEEAWTKAQRIERFYEILPGRPTKLIPYRNVKAFFLYDENFLYLGAIIRDNDIIADPEHKNLEKEKLFLSADTFELFIQPDPARPTYFEMHINPLGVTWDSKFIAQAYLSFRDPSEWDSNLKAAVHLNGTLNKIDGDHSWIVELAIPFSSFTDKEGRPFEVSSGKQWRFSVCLYDYSYFYDNGSTHSSRKYISSSKFRVLSFHSRQYYDLLQFE